MSEGEEIDDGDRILGVVFELWFLDHEVVRNSSVVDCQRDNLGLEIGELRWAISHRSLVRLADLYGKASLELHAWPTWPILRMFSTWSLIIYWASCSLVLI